MKEFELTADIRDELGSRASRRMRRDNRIPAVLYGAKKDTISLFLDANELNKKLENESFGSRVLTLGLQNQKEAVVLRTLQRHPVNSRVIHVDFQRVSATQQLQLRVPLRFINEEHSAAKRMGAVFSRLITEVEVVCLPKDLPEAISVDISEVEIGQTMHLSELTPPEGVTFTALSQGMDQGMISVSASRVLSAEDEDVDVEVGEEQPEDD